jgi:hypothetical protein
MEIVCLQNAISIESSTKAKGMLYGAMIALQWAVTKKALRPVHLKRSGKLNENLDMC